MPITPDQIRRSVAEYDATRADEDRHLAERLQTPDSLTKICLVAAWGEIPHFSFKQRINMANCFAGDLMQGLLHEAEGIHWVDWLENPLEMGFLLVAFDAVEHLLRGGNQEGDRQLSLFSKFLHYGASNAFPIWDSRARNTIRRVQEWRVDDATTLDSYAGWVLTIHALVIEHQDLLVELGEAAGGESPVRTLDKALYIINGRQDY
jgi:hypothetical protein